MGDTGPGNILLITHDWGVSGTQGVGGILVGGGIEVIEGGKPHQKAQAVSGPLPPAQYKPGGR